MTSRSTQHDTFTIERTYDATRAQVFGAWADPMAKMRWFARDDDWNSVGYELDFQVGGQERLLVSDPSGRVYTYEARYHDIVHDERIVYAYDMYLDETRITVSLATVELKAVGAKTLLKFTEQMVMLDGGDNISARRRGTEELLDSLGAMLQRDAVAV